MIEKVIHRRVLGDRDSLSDDLRYWRSKPSAERLSAVDFLRAQFYGHSKRLQRVARIIKQKRG